VNTSPGEEEGHGPVAAEDPGSPSSKPVELASPLANSAIKYSIAASASPWTSRRTYRDILGLRR
jgi:hypothetical protein